MTGERAHYELAAGRPVTGLVQAIENFASKGGMLPEQLWDQRDIPAANMYFGGTSGSAMPLMWAHAEYLKLLRSIINGEVFDRIPAVADRYLAGRGRKDLEVWKARRQVRRIAAGNTLRVQCVRPFELQWSADEWRTVNRTASTPTRLGVEYVDVAVPANQQAPIKFTFFWTGTGQWEGRDYEVGVSAR